MTMNLAYILRLYPNKAYIYMAEGPIWEGGAIDKKNKKLYQTVNHTPTIMRAIFTIVMATQ